MSYKVSFFENKTIRFSLFQKSGHFSLICFKFCPSINRESKYFFMTSFIDNKDKYYRNKILDEWKKL